MKKMLLLPIWVCVLSFASAQTDSLKWVNEINEQVWKPFVTHFISGNTEGFSSVHSKRVTRVEIDRGILKDYEKYFPPVAPASSPVKKNTSRLFELRFDKRISNGTKAWETGYYKGTVMQEGKEPRSYYGRFFVVLEKEEGVWKILVDADTGKEANEENFGKAFAMEGKR
ncbi:MAG: hypothetical protein JNM14_15520 [Ferruginibacter sp.]|nr:hypothetical protein [Ferruginibacter sp.]